MSNEPQEIIGLNLYDSRFAIESGEKDGKPVFLISEHNEKGIANQHIADTYLEAITRFASCIDTQAQFHLRNDPHRLLPDNGVLTAEVCVEGSRADDYTDKIIVLSPEALRPEYRRASDQLIYATNGFGCSPTAMGTRIIGMNLCTGEDETHRRENFMGIADIGRLPMWARSAWHELSTLNRHAAEKAQRNSRPPSR